MRGKQKQRDEEGVRGRNKRKETSVDYPGPLFHASKNKCELDDNEKKDRQEMRNPTWILF